MGGESERFELTIEPPRAGCVRVTVALNGERQTFVPSYIGDVFEGLVGTVADIAESRALTSGSVSFDWQDEPGSWRWELEPSGKHITIRVAKLPKNFAGGNEQGEQVLEWQVPSRRFCNCVLRAMDRLASIPREEFEREWRDGLASAKVARLRLALARWR